MRVLLNDESGNTRIVEINDIGFTSNIFTLVKGIPQSILEKQKPLKGMYMVDYKGDHLFMEDESVEECAIYCKDIYTKGCIDLTRSYVTAQYEDYYRNMVIGAVGDLPKMDQF